MAESRQRNCVNEIDFYREIEELKGHLKTKDSHSNCYLEDDFYKKSKHFLKEKTEKELRLSAARPARNKDRSKPKQLTKWSNI